jgi:hypothetical protein
MLEAKKMSPANIRSVPPTITVVLSFRPMRMP